jgi:hypothetical protein
MKATQLYERTPGGKRVAQHPHIVVVGFSPSAPVCRVEVEVFDTLIGRFEKFAANDNEQPSPPFSQRSTP